MTDRVLGSEPSALTTCGSTTSSRSAPMMDASFARSKPEFTHLAHRPPPTSDRPGNPKMNKLCRSFCTISLMMAPPSIVAAQSNPAFDGTYEVVSVDASVCTPLDDIPRPLTVHNGIARLTSGSQASGPLVFEGNASPQG